jgi:2-(1,2-epoxy-1,2-dihydrophenyl)acetyl-CoA isomerase
VVLDVVHHGSVLELTLNRPDALNALTTILQRDLTSALKEARKADVRAVIITGAGRAFCAGQDLTEAQDAEIGPGERLRRFYNPNLRSIRKLDKPVIAAINGVAAGAGIALALSCDLRIASEKSRFVPAFIAIGLIPDSGLSWQATRILGESRAFDWLTSNRSLTAEDALAWGLVQEVVSPDRVLSRAHERAEELCATAGDAAGLTKRLLRLAMVSDLDEQLEVESHLQQLASEHPAYALRVASFLGSRQQAR